MARTDSHPGLLLRQVVPSRALAALLGLVLALVVTPTSSSAGNRDSFLLGNQAALSGGAVTATVRDGGALWYNPAGLGQNERRRFNVNANALILRYRDLAEGVQTNLVGIDDDTSLSSVEFLAVPSTGSLTVQLREGISLSIGSFVTIQDMYRVQTTIEGLVPDTGERVTELIEMTGAQGTVLLGAGLGFQPKPVFRLGFSLFAVYNNYSQSGSLALSMVEAGDDPSSRGSLLYNGKSNLSRVGIDSAFGIQLAPVGGLRIGLCIRPVRLMFARFGEDFDVRSQTVLTPNLTFSEFVITEQPDTEQNALLARMPNVTLGLAWEGRRFSIAVGGDITPALKGANGLEFRRLLWNLRVGAHLGLSERLSLGLGVFTDRSDLPNPRRFRDVRVDYYGGTVGLQGRNPVKLASDERAEALTLVWTLALRYAAGIGEAGQLGVHLDGFDNIHIDVTFAGTHPVLFHEVALHIGSALLF